MNDFILERVPRLKGFVTFEEAAPVLGVIKRRVDAMARAGQFKKIVQVGSGPIYLIPVEDLRRVWENRSSRGLTQGEWINYDN